MFIDEENGVNGREIEIKGDDIINKLFKLLTKKHYRFLMIANEILPIYHDRFKTTSKTIVLVENQEKVFDSSAVIIEGREYSNTFNEIRRKYKKVHTNINIECQRGNPIQIYKNFKKHTGDSNFTLNEFKEGMILEINGLGFLGDIKAVKNIFLVTDKHVFIQNILDKGIGCYSYEELKRLKEYGALKFL